MLYLFNINSTLNYNQNNNASLYWKLPKSSNNVLQTKNVLKQQVPMALSMVICPENEKMVAAFENNNIQVYDILNKCFDNWTKQNEGRLH